MIWRTHFLSIIIVLILSAALPLIADEGPQDLHEALKKTSSSSEKLEILLKLHHYYLNEKDFKNAIQFGEEGLALIESDSGLPENPDFQLELIKLFQDSDRFDKALELSEKGTARSLETGNFKQASRFLSQSGFSLWQTGKYQSALDAYTQCVQLQEEHHFEENLAESLRCMGRIYNDLNLHELALTMYFKSLKAPDASGEETGKTLNSIGVVYHKMGNTEKALEYYDRVLDVQRQAENKKGMADVLNNIGVEYQARENYILAEDFYLRSMELEKELGNRIGICDGLNNLGEIKSEMGDLDSALQNFQESMKIAKEFEDDWRIADSLRNIAKIQRLKNQTQIAIELIEASLKKGLAAEDRSLLKDIYAEMALVYEKKGNYEKAFSAQGKYLALKEEFYSEAGIRSAIEFDVKYKTEKSAKEIEILKKDSEIQRMITTGMGAGIASGFLLLLLLYRNYRIKIKANREIQLKNKALSEARDELERLSRTDALTGLSNRRDMMERIMAEKTRFERSRQTFTIILSDIDKFKTFNDTYGHECGDVALKTVSKVLSSSIRKQDSVCRWGGEEFLFLLPETTLEGGKQLAEKLRQRVEAERVHYNDLVLPVTMTFGVAEYQSELIEPCIHEADKALYRGKEQGRNCVMTSDSV